MKTERELFEDYMFTSGKISFTEDEESDFRLWNAARKPLLADLAVAIEALQLSQTSIRQLRDQGAPCAYWDDVEAKNIEALARLSSYKEGK